MSLRNTAPGKLSGEALNLASTVIDRLNRGKDLSNAVVLVNKPGGFTSFDVVRLLRRVARTRKVGHAGTLDPMATGLLVCMTGRSTKLSRFFLEMEKEYSGTIRLGETTASYDADSPVDRVVDAHHVTRDAIRAVTSTFLGEIIQQTPPYSAVRVEGRPLYERARRGDLRSGPPRVVTIHSFDIVDKRGADVDFRMSCSKGTYVRALAHDLGEQLGVGAHLIRLHRDRIGDYCASNALTVNDLSDYAGDDPFRDLSESRDHAS
ncbi:MAG: tRNA pseudouridine(55) synthase TruB [Rhodothermales bacterium]|nr:tRNA pseudouridine(55) synthase TruB [Rhodothermales bacterium]